MLIHLTTPVQAESRDKIIHLLRTHGYRVQHVHTQYQDYLVALGGKEVDLRTIGNMQGIAAVYNVPDAYPLVSATWHHAPTVIDLGDGVTIGGKTLAILAGPCAVESEEQVSRIVAHLAANNVAIMRGGIFKPRTSPYSFQGMGIPGLDILHQQCSKKGIKIVTEITNTSQLEGMIDHVDMLQVGARNTQNYDLLKALGTIDKPVLIKRGISGTIDELLHAAEYIFSRGNENIVLCERGIRTYETSYRNTLDLNAIPILQAKTHLPVLVDPSHGIGIRQHVPTMALAGVMSGADGVLLEVHPCPEEAASDGQQTLHLETASTLYPLLHEAYALYHKSKALLT